MATRISPVDQPFTEEEKGALRRVEVMLEAGTVALGPDPWRGGSLSFHRPAVVARWLATSASKRRPGLLRRLWRAAVD